MFRLTRTQNRGFSLRCITYNMHRLTNLIKLMMFSTNPIGYELRQNEVMTTQRFVEVDIYLVEQKID